MTIYKPMRLLLAGMAALIATTAALSPVLPWLALTAFAIVGFWAVIFGVGFWCWLTDGEPPPPLSHQLQVREREVIDVRSQRVS
jgi:hypothetical protein